MQKPNAKTIYTIGHSTRPMEEFLEMLKSFGIQALADIRSFPGSKKFPRFNKENLELVLPEHGIEYFHFKNLGGRRKPQKDSKNNRWRNASFKAYADYMETEEFQKAIAQLKNLAKEKTTAYMCSEAVWWRCHRSLVSDTLKAECWRVLHIMSTGKTEEHPYTSPAIIINGKVCYSDKNLFD